MTTAKREVLRPVVCAIAAALKICLLRAVVFPMGLQHDVQMQQNRPIRANLNTNGSKGSCIWLSCCETATNWS